MIAMRHAYNRRDVFVWFPTGFGKLLVYECLPFLFNYKRKDTGPYRAVLDVSPLVALMVDHVSSLQRRGMSSTMCLNLRSTVCIQQSIWSVFKDGNGVKSIPGKHVCVRPCVIVNTLLSCRLITTFHMSDSSLHVVWAVVLKGSSLSLSKLEVIL